MMDYTEKKIPLKEISLPNFRFVLKLTHEFVLKVLKASENNNVKLIFVIIIIDQILKSFQRFKFFFY